MASETDRCEGALMDKSAKSEYDNDQPSTASTTTCPNSASRRNEIGDTAPTLGYYFTNSRRAFQDQPRIVWCYGVSSGMGHSFVPTASNITTQRSLQDDLETHYKVTKGKRQFETKLYDLGLGGEWPVPDFARMMIIPWIKKKHPDCIVVELTPGDHPSSKSRANNLDVEDSSTKDLVSEST